MKLRDEPIVDCQLYLAMATLAESGGNWLISRSSATDPVGTVEFASRPISKGEVIRHQNWQSRPMREGGAIRKTEAVTEQNAVEGAVMT